ncbi:MAG: hypothetical protein Q9218_006591 [Villophora microphyllina]
MNGQHYPMVSARHSHPSAQPSATNYGSLNDDVYDQYVQVPQYLLPGQDPQATISSYSTQDMSRGWTPISSSTKHLTSTLGYETDPSFKYSNSHFPHMNSSAMAAVGTEDSLLSRHGSRILPHPRKTSVDPSSHSYQKPGESASYNLPFGHSQRSSVAYSPQTSVNWGSQGSASSTSLSTYSGGPVSSSASSSPPMDYAHTTAFGYSVPLCTTPLQPTAQVSRAPAEDHPIDNDRTITRRSFGTSARTAATHLHASLPIHVSPKSYSYSLAKASSDSAKGATSSMSPELSNTLVNEKPYQRIREKPINYNPSAPLPTEKAILPNPKATSAGVAASRQR